MRRLAPTVLLALLAACTVTTTGAPCGSDLECPTGQGCGSDGRCGVDALSCPGHTLAGQCRPGITCAAGQLVTCTAGSGVCSNGPIASACPAHQQCTPSATSAACACSPTRCSATTSGFCSTGGQVVSCAQDASSSKACWYESASATCGDPGATCFESGGGATCACPSADACTQLDAGQCSATGNQVLRCRPVVSGSACLTWQAEATCSDPGTTCVAAGGSAACTCPAANGCPTRDATRCSAAADQVQRCQPVVTGSACLSWQAGTDCAGGGLVCTASACACPVNSGTTFFADPVGGTAAGSAPHPTGIASPATCRYQTLTDAVAAANALGAGSTVKAAGWSAATPGGVAVFSEPGALAIGAGVTVTTDDSPLTTGHYAVTTPAALTGPFVSLAPGGALSGYEVRNGASTGPGVQTTCPGVADVAPVSLSTVRVAAASGGTPAVRFSSGVHVAGYCPATLASLTVDGAATGILVDSAGPPPLVEQSTASATHVTNSTSVGVSVVEGKISFTGGTVDLNAAGVSVGAAGTGAPTFSATGTTFSGNTGDAIYVGRGTLFSDGCPYVNNGTHVHAQPVGTSAISLTVQNSSGAAKMTGATNSAFRLLAMGSGSTVVVSGNEVISNGASQDYNVATGLRRGGGMVLTPPLPGTSTVRSTLFSLNKFDQVLVAASVGTLDLSGGPSCGPQSNTFKCYDSGGAVGLFSNGATVNSVWNHWTQQPGAVGIDVGGSGITGYDTSACAPATLTCP